MSDSGSSTKGTDTPSPRPGAGARRTLLAPLLALVGALLGPLVHADQYRSETREVNGRPPPRRRPPPTTPPAVTPPSPIAAPGTPSATPPPAASPAGVVQGDIFIPPPRSVAPPAPTPAPARATPRAGPLIDPAFIEALRLRDAANAAVARRDWPAAIASLDAAIATGSLTPASVARLRTDIATLRAALVPPKSRRELLTEAVSRPDAPATAFIALGAEDQKAGDTAGALDAYRRGLARAGGRAQPAWVRSYAALLLAQGRDAEALPYLERLAVLEPNLADNWRRVVVVKLKRGDLAGATAWLELAARQGPLASPDDRLRLVALLEIRQAPFESASLLARWLDAGLVARDAGTLDHLATLWARARAWGPAASAEAEAQRLSPETARLKRLALYAEAAGDVDGAAQASARLAATGTDPTAWLDAGRLASAAGDPAAARRAYTRALAYAPLEARARAGLARLDASGGDGPAPTRPPAVAVVPSPRLAGPVLSLRVPAVPALDPLEPFLARLQRPAAPAPTVARADALAAARMPVAPSMPSPAVPATPPHATLVLASAARGSGAPQQAAPPAPGAAPPATATAGPAAAATGGAATGLTPVGAEAGPSQDGSIPAWDGTRYRAPVASPGRRPPDPFAGEKPLYVITRTTLPRYAAHLADGHKALFVRYADYHMPVYPSHRIVTYPQAVLAATRANDGRARLVGSDRLTGARLGFPFPRPHSGVEVLWNHRVRYRGDTFDATTAQAVVDPAGKREMLRQTERVAYRYGSVAHPADLASSNVLLYYLTWFGRSRTDVSFVALVHETADSEKGSRGVWVIPPNIGKMFRIPPVGYDQPFPGSDGLQFIDMVDMYNGPFDRYVWKLVGKRELIVPYDATRASAASNRYDGWLGGRFPRPEAFRYEAHRVWVVEASTREGTTHAFGKRVFYVDEDSWNVLLVENFDHAGKLWRFQEGHLIFAPDVLAANTAPVVLYDLRDGRYFINRLAAEEPPPAWNQPMDDGEFAPNAVKNRYAR